jgi:hypothetical protein
MTPVPWLRILLALSVLAVASGSGWMARSWKADADLAALRLTIARGVASAAIEARTIERKQQEIVNHVLRTQNEALAGVADGLRADLERMRRRPERPANAAGMPDADRAACAGASGAELSRPDAEFLVREAARADDLRAGLLACYAVIDAR